MSLICKILRLVNVASKCVWCGHELRYTVTLAELFYPFKQRLVSIFKVDRTVSERPKNQAGVSGLRQENNGCGGLLYHLS